MGEERIQRRLAAILAGRGRVFALMGADEAGTLDALRDVWTNASIRRLPLTAAESSRCWGMAR
jgi:hypothetical protein